MEAKKKIKQKCEKRKGEKKEEKRVQGMKKKPLKNKDPEKAEQKI